MFFPGLRGLVAPQIMSKKHELAANETIQSNHDAGTPAALLARILALEEKVNPKPAKAKLPTKAAK